MNQQKDDNTQDIDLKKKLEEAAKQAAEKDKKEEKIENEKSELEQTKEELAKITELAKRTMADLENMRRRQNEEKASWICTANADLIKKLLPVMDNLERSKEHMPSEKDEATQKWAEGIDMSINQLKKLLEEEGVQPIESKGKPFNPDLHEALLQDAGEKNIILEELEKGYTINGKVLRHAKVKVGNGEQGK